MKTARILVVDDEITIRHLLEDFFCGLGYEVVAAANGAEALRIIGEEDFDCVISDHVMPDMDGLELLKEIRAQNRKMVFLMITGYPTIEVAVEAMKQGAYDYITKPLQLDDVKMKVNRALLTKHLEKSVKKLTGIAWGIIISIPIWLILGILVGKIWR